MSVKKDCEAIEKGLKDLIFSMSNGETLSNKELTSNTPFPLDVSNLQTSFIQPPSFKVPFSNLAASDTLLKQENSSELIDLNALTEFSAKHIDDPTFKSPTKEIKLPHPEQEEENHQMSTSEGVSVLFKTIKSSPNFANLPENPFLNTKNVKKRDKNVKKKRKKERKKDTSQNDNIKLLEKDKMDINTIQPLKNPFSCIGREYSLTCEMESSKFQCYLCNFVAERRGVIDAHLLSKNHLNQVEIAEKEMMLPFLPEPIAAQVEAITEFLTSQVSKRGLLKADLNTRTALSLKFSRFVSERVPSCSVNLIGSSATGIGLKSSEVDFVINVASQEMIPDALEALHDAVKSDEENYEKVIAEFRQSRPKVRFVDRQSKLNCNIHIDYGGAFVKVAELISTYCKLDDRVKILGIAVRYWAKLCDIDQQDRGTLPSFSFVLMVVYFLQQVQPPVLPALHEDPQFSSHSSFYDKYVKEHRWKSSNTDSIGLLWLKFLKFYALEYKLGETVVCIRSSKKITCKEYNWNTRFYAINEPYQKRNMAYVIPSFQVCHFIQNCFLRTYRYFAYPQMQRGFQAIQLMKLQDFDIFKFIESIKCPVVKEEDSEDQEVSENEDSTSTPDLLNVSQDLEDHDPDVPLDSMISVITNLNIDQISTEDANESEHDEEEPSIKSDDFALEDKKLRSNSDTKESLSKTPKSTKQIPFYYWNIAGKNISKTMFFYQLEKNIVKGEKNVPIVCGNCKRGGHLKKDCPIDDIPKPGPLPEMNQDYLDAITSALYSIFETNSVDENRIKEVEHEMLDIEASIKEVFPDAKLHLFGSLCNGFGFRNNSDLDFCLTFGENKDGKDLDSIDIINKIAKELEHHPKLENVLAITSAKVPIVKFAWKESKLEGDISLYNTLALNNTKMLDTYCKIDSRVQVLGYALKYFAKTVGICDASRGSLSSYAYILMVLYFLQQRDPPVIPVLQEIYEEEKPVELIDDWNVWFYKDVDKLKDKWPDYGKNNESVSQLWLGLLCFYACEFDWKEYVISIKQKTPLRRFKKLWISDGLAIEDPFDLNHNLGGGLSRKMNSYILKAFIRGRERCGTPVSLEKLQAIHKKEVSWFFGRNFLNSGCEPPHDRGCGNCGKIGHIRKNCPQEKTCAYCRIAGHLIKDCPRRPSWSREQRNSKERNRNYDDNRGANEKVQNQGKVVPHMISNDIHARTYPVMQLQSQNQLETQKKLLQMGVPMHRMVSPNFMTRNMPNPPPGFKTNASMYPNASRYPPAFNNSRFPNVPPFPKPVNNKEMHSQSSMNRYPSPSKQYASSPPKQFPKKKPFRQGSEPPGWSPNHRPSNFQVERHPSPQVVQGNNYLLRQERPLDPRDNSLVKHKSNHGDRRNRTKSDHLSYNSSRSGWD